MSDLSDAIAAVNALVSKFGLTRDQAADLLSGPVDGGPGGNGYYPVTLADGTSTVLIPSPKKIAALASSMGRVAETWAALSTQVAAQNDAANVLDSDPGTHVDPITGATVSNGGLYSFQAGTPMGWKRVSSTSGADALTPLVAQASAARDEASGFAAAVAAVAAGLQFSLTGDRYLYGKRVAFGRGDIVGRSGDAITDDGYHFAKYAIRVTGATWSRGFDGFWTLDLNSLALASYGFAAGGSMTAANPYYIAGQQVSWAVADTANRIALAALADGTIYIPKLSSPALDLAGGTAALETADYVFEAVTDSGKRRLRRTGKASGVRALVTPATSHAFAPRLSADGTRLIYLSDRSGIQESWYQLASGARAGGSVEHPVVPRPTITPLGDSLTAGGYADSVAAAFGTSLTTPSSVPLAPGGATAGGGIGSQKADQIAARYGAVALTCSVSGNVLASGANVLTAISTAMLSRSADTAGATRTLRAYLTRANGAKVAGLLTATQQSSAAGGAILYETGSWYLYTFTPDAGQALGATTAGAEIEIDPEARQDSVLLVWIGRNDVGAGAGWQDEVKARLAAIVAAYKPLVRRIVIVGVINGRNEPSGSANHGAIVTLNADLAALYPDSFIDVRPAYNAGSSDDTPTTANSADGLHYTTAGRAVIVNAVTAFINAKGWYA